MSIDGQIEVCEMLLDLKPKEPNRPLLWPEPEAECVDVASKVVLLANKCLHLDPLEGPTATQCVQTLCGAAGIQMHVSK